MSILSVVFLAPFILATAFAQTETQIVLTTPPIWEEYTPQWCTAEGHSFLSRNMPLSEDCKKLCIKMNPECLAIEWWENRGGICYECTNISLRTEFDDFNDLGYPPHVFILQQAKERAVDKCKPNPCLHEAACNSSLDGYQCTCPSGYTGTNCEKAFDNCEPNPCLHQATCSSSLQGYECTCSPGYTGINCEKDINECAKQNGGCSHKCTNTKGSYSCSCPDPELNLALDRRTCAASGVSVECRKNDMSITLPKSLLLGLNREHVTLRDVSCVATETNTHYTLKTALTGCGTTAKHKKGAVVYSNTVLEIPVKDDAIITRVREIEIPFSCYYKNSGDATAVGVKPDTRKLVFDEDGKGNFTVALDMFLDDKFTPAYTQTDFPVQVKLSQDLYFQASVKSKDKRLSVLAENCYATPSQDRQHATKYHLIKDGCPVDETTSVLISTKVGISRFTTEGFKFIADHPFVFVHCHIRICDAGNPISRCAQGCIEGTRKRRDVGSDDKLYPLAQGPLTIDDDAKEMNGKHKTMQGATLPTVLSLAVISAICLVGMIWLSRKKPSKPTIYTPLLMTSED